LDVVTHMEVQLFRRSATPITLGGVAQAVLNKALYQGIYRIIISHLLQLPSV